MEKQGAMAASYQAGYRLAMITAGAGVLWIAAAVAPSATGYDFHPWQVAYSVMAACMVVGMLTTLIITEPKPNVAPGTLEREAHARTELNIRAIAAPGWTADMAV